MLIQNPNDQQAIRTSVESAGEDVLDVLPGLTPEQSAAPGGAHLSVPVPLLVSMCLSYASR